MRQIGSYDRADPGGTNLGWWMQGRVVAETSMVGNLVTLADGETQKPAEYLTDMKSIQKYVQSDGNPASGRDKVIVIFVFDGTVFGQIRGGDIVTFQGVRYNVNTPLYPQFVAGSCVSLACACNPI